MKAEATLDPPEILGIVPLPENPPRMPELGSCIFKIIIILWRFIKKKTPPIIYKIQ
jgi:hypothetical protein